MIYQYTHYVNTQFFHTRVSDYDRRWYRAELTFFSAVVSSLRRAQTALGGFSRAIREAIVESFCGTSRNIAGHTRLIES